MKRTPSVFNRFPILLVYLTIGAFLHDLWWGPLANADTFKLTSPETYDHYAWEIPPGSRGKLIVYLQSSGDPLDGFNVELVDTVREKTLFTKLSDPTGEVYFEPLKAGTYRIYLRRNQKQIRSSSVKIGDFRLFVDDVEVK